MGYHAHTSSEGESASGARPHVFSVERSDELAEALGAVETGATAETEMGGDNMTIREILLAARRDLSAIMQRVADEVETGWVGVEEQLRRTNEAIRRLGIHVPEKERGESEERCRHHRRVA